MNQHGQTEYVQEEDSDIPDQFQELLKISAETIFDAEDKQRAKVDRQNKQMKKTKWEVDED